MHRSDQLLGFQKILLLLSLFLLITIEIDVVSLVNVELPPIYLGLKDVLELTIRQKLPLVIYLLLMHRIFTFSNTFNHFVKLCPHFLLLFIDGLPFGDFLFVTKNFVVILWLLHRSILEVQMNYGASNLHRLRLSRSDSKLFLYHGQSAKLGQIVFQDETLLVVLDHGVLSRHRNIIDVQILIVGPPNFEGKIAVSWRLENLDDPHCGLLQRQTLQNDVICCGSLNVNQCVLPSFHLENVGVNLVTNFAPKRRPDQSQRIWRLLLLLFLLQPKFEARIVHETDSPNALANGEKWIFVRIGPIPAKATHWRIRLIPTRVSSHHRLLVSFDVVVVKTGSFLFIVLLFFIISVGQPNNFGLFGDLGAVGFARDKFRRRLLFFVYFLGRRGGFIIGGCCCSGSLR